METPANATVTVVEGDLFHVTNGGGGGLGDPLLRDPALVARDVADGYVLEHVAREVYGVVLSTGGDADAAATEAARSESRRERLGAEPSRQVLPATEIEVGVGVRVSGGAWACGYCAAELGSLAENYRAACVVRARPAPEALAELGMHARARESKRVVISEYFCPECGGCVRADIGLEGAEMAPAPQLAG